MALDEIEKKNQARIKDALGEALGEPTVPPGLLERTAVRGTAIENGRAAEARLGREGDNLPADVREHLLAESVIGRLMLTTAAPEGVDLATMTNQLLAEPRFSQLAAQPTAKLLSDLQTGRLLGALANPSAGKNAPAPDRQPPVRKPPEKDGPTL